MASKSAGVDVLFDVTYVLQLAPTMSLDYVSESVADVTGHSAAEYCADSRLWGAAMDHRDRALMTAAFNARVGEPVLLEVRWMVGEGDVVWAQQISRTVVSDSGELRLYAGLIRVETPAVLSTSLVTPLSAPGENVADTVVRTDLAGEIVSVSESIRAIGWTPDRLMGTASRDLFPGSDMAVVGRLVSRAIVGETFTGVVARMYTGDGRLHFISATLRPALAPDGTITGAYIVWPNVDEVLRNSRQAETERRVLRATQDAQLDPQILAQAVRDGSGEIVDLRYLEANPAACRAMGRTRSQILGSDMAVLNPGVLTTEVVVWLGESITKAEPLVVNDFAYTMADGQVGRYDLRAVPVGDAISVTWRDVTQRFHRTESLARSEARYRLLFQESSDIVTFHSPDGEVQWVSPAIERLLGWLPDERTRTDLSLIHPDDMPAVIAVRDQLLSGAESGTTRLRLRGKDGVYRWMESTARAVRDESGDVRSLVVVTHDVHLQMDAEEALADSESRYRLLAENATDVVYRVSAAGITEWVSEGFERVLGLKPEDFIGRPGMDLVAPADREIVERATAAAVDGESNRVRFRVVAAAGQLKWIEATLHPVFDSHGDLESIVGGWRDVNAEVAAQRKLDERARTDDLTGLLNRREALDQLMAGLEPGHNRDELAVAFCDVDGFKAINDAHGHAVGDRLLQIVSERVQGSVRAADTVARVGGDEILLILPGIRSLADAMIIAEKVRAAVGVPCEIDGVNLRVSLSIGVTIASAEDDVDALIARADRAMYVAKGSGRDQVVRLG